MWPTVPRLSEVVAATKAEEPERRAFVVLRPARQPFTVRREDDAFRVSGSRVERWVAETDLEDPRQVTELQRRLIRAGVERVLEETGARRGDEVRIGARPSTIPGRPDEEPAAARGPGEPRGRQDLTMAEDAGWSEFLGLVESLTDDELVEPGYSPEGWSVKDLIAHIGCWQAEAGRILQQVAAGTFHERAIDVDEMNRRFFEENRDLPLPILGPSCSRPGTGCCGHGRTSAPRSPTHVRGVVRGVGGEPLRRARPPADT